MVKVTSLLVKTESGRRFGFGVRAWIEIKIWCVKGMYRLKLVSSEKDSGFKGLFSNIDVDLAYVISCQDYFMS